jgi:polar amino acid transport system substrate-binding protein
MMHLEKIQKSGLLGLVFLAVTIGLPGSAFAETDRLDVRTKTFAPFAFEQGGEWKGFSIDLWKEIAGELGVEYSLRGEESVSELLETVSIRTADVAVAGITVTAEREGMVDFTHPFYESGLQILTRVDAEGGGLLSVLESSGLLDVLIVLFLSLLLMSHLMWIIERLRGGEQFAETYPRGIWDAFWWAAVTVTTVGYGDKVPRGDVARVLALLWMFTGLILVSFFTASVTTALTLEKLEGTISGPGDLARKVVAATTGSTSATAVMEHGGTLVEVAKVDEGYELLSRGEVDAVVYDAPVLQYHASREGGGVVVVVGPVFQRESYGIALQEGSPYREKINTILLEFRENGTYDRLHEKWFGRAP